MICALGSGCSGESAGADDGAASGGSDPNGSGGATATTGGSGPVGSGGDASGGTDAGSGGAVGTGGAATGGDGSGGAATGGDGSGGEGSGGEGNGSGGEGSGSGGEASTGGSGGAFTGTCTASKPTGRNVSGSGPHQVVMETNSEPGIQEGTIYRPADLGPGKKYPILVWGQGACSRDGLATQAAMAETASHGYIVVADGTPGGTEPGRPLGGGGDVLLSYIDWVISENDKPCSAFYQSVDTTKVAANGFSCGGLMAAGTSADPRMTTWGHMSSGSFSVNPAFYNAIHTPVLIVTGTADSLGAHNNGQRDFENISALGDIPVMMFAKVGADHGGDLWAPNGGHFTKINVAWLNWWLKGDQSATGKGALVGANCSYCKDNTWQIQSANLP